MAPQCQNRRKIAIDFRHLHGYISWPFSGKRHQIQRPTVFARRKFGLKTHTREGGLSVKIVLARFAPSKNANLSKSANFRFASLTPLATNPSAQLYGGLVTMLSAPDCDIKKSTPA